MAEKNTDKGSSSSEQHKINPEVQDTISDEEIEEWQINSGEESDSEDSEEEEEDFYKHLDSEDNDQENISVMPEKNNIAKAMNFEDMKNRIMFQPSNMSVWEVFHMVTTISLKYNLSDEVQQAILNALKILSGPEFNDLDTSKYFMKKIFDPPQEVISYVFYCSLCSSLLTPPVTKKVLSKNKEVRCEKCNVLKKLSLNADNYFLTLDLQYQLRLLLENSAIRKMIDDNQSTEVSGITIRDIQDSDRYRNDDFIKSKNKEDNKRVLTLNVNTDGTPQFENGRHSFWPIQCVVNKIPKHFRSKFILLAALCYTVCEPQPEFMNIFLDTFIKQIKQLMEYGVTIVTESKTVLTYYVKIFCFPVDSVARPVMQNCLQFNGSFGCSWCYHPTN